MKENKDNIWLQARKSCGDLSRDDVEEKTEGRITAKILENIENGRTLIKPEHIIELSRVYNKPELALNYCSQICPIGKTYMPKYEFSLTSPKDLPIITLELIDTLNTLVLQKDRLIGIVADGKIDEEEKADFVKFNEGLEKMELAINALKAWANKNINM